MKIPVICRISLAAALLCAAAYGQDDGEAPAKAAPETPAPVSAPSAPMTADDSTYADDAIDADANAEETAEAAPPAEPKEPTETDLIKQFWDKEVFSEDVINSLFGAAGEAAPDTAAAKRELPPFQGNYKIMIGRPIYAAYDRETESRWISPMAELYTYYKASAFPRTHVFTMEQVDGVMPPGWRDYDRKFNRPHFVEAARRLGATHVIYQEYLPGANGKEMMFASELYWIQEDASAAKVFDTVKYANFEAGLDKCLAVIAKAVDGAAVNSEPFKQRLFPGVKRFLEPFGNILADEGALTPRQPEESVPAAPAKKPRRASAKDTRAAKEAQQEPAPPPPIVPVERAAAAYAAATPLIAEFGSAAGVQYAAALLAARAGYHAKAVEHINAVIAAPGAYPALQLLNASYMRRAGYHDYALRAALAAAQNPALKTPAAIEMAMTHSATGDAKRAREIYVNITQSGDADAAAYFQLALIDAAAGRYEDSEITIAAAEEKGLSFRNDQYRELGLAFGRDVTRADRAVELHRLSMGANPNNPAAWNSIAEIYRAAENKEGEAAALVNIFRITPTEANVELIKAAGALYTEAGAADKAKAAYNVAVGRGHMDRGLSLALARIHFNERDCQKLPDIIRWIDTIPEAAKMLTECGFRVIDESQTISARKKTPKVILAARIAAGTIAAGALAAGIYCNSEVQAEGKRYRDHALEGAPPKGTPAENYNEVQKMREYIDKNAFRRDMLYLLSILGAAGLSVTFFF